MPQENLDANQLIDRLRLLESKTKQHAEDIIDLTSSFAKDDEGRPDFNGHRQYHKKQIENTKEYAQSRATVIRNIVTWLVIGALTIFSSSVVQWIISSNVTTVAPK